MLTPNEVHLLVGILAMASSDQDVQLELGSQLTDQASGTTRDVDITLRYLTPDGPRLISGIEVKAHSRPLDIEHVEQLVIKLKDVGLSHAAIVSASGYTSGAVTKARAHGIRLFSLVPWCAELARRDNPLRGDRAFLLSDIHWSEGPHSHVELDTTDILPSGINPAALEVWIETTEGSFVRRPIEVVTRQAAKFAADQAEKSFPPKTAPGNHEVQIATPVTLRNQVRVITPLRTYPLKFVGITGRLCESISDGRETLRFLVNHDDRTLEASCCAMAMSDGTINVLAFDQRTRAVTLHTLSVADRQLAKIKGIPLVQQTDRHRLNLIETL